MACTGGTSRREHLTTIAGVSQDVGIPCNSEEDVQESFGGGVSWIINGSVYGLLHVPKEFIVCSSESCDLTTLTIPVIQSEMNGLMLQCVVVDYLNSILHLGDVTVITVHSLPSNGTFNINGDYSIITVHIMIMLSYLQMLVLLEMIYQVTT
jgi:hypothetical protein